MEELESSSLSIYRRASFLCFSRYTFQLEGENEASYVNSFRDVTRHHPLGREGKKKGKKINAVILEESREGIPYRGGPRFSLYRHFKKER